MKLSMGINYSGGFKEAVAARGGTGEGRSRPGVDRRGVQLRRHQPGGLPRRQDRAGGDRHRHRQRVLAHRGADGHDRGRLRLRQRRSVHPRPRCQRPAGHRRLPRRAVREADAAHQGVHRGLPHDLEARGEVRVPRPDREGAAARRPGHRAGQAAEDHQPPGALRHPHLVGQPEGQAASRPPPSWPTAGCRSCSSPRSTTTCGARS